MSKRAYISRYMLIIKRLKAKPYSTYEELQTYIDNQFEYLQMQDDTLQIGFSKRTLQRDIREIRVVFGIEISYSKQEQGYYIQQNEMENMNFQRILEAFDMFNSLNLAKDLSGFVNLETRKPLGTENIYGLIHSIKNNFQIKFSYLKFSQSEINLRNCDPLALKEYKNRWYLIASDHKDEIVKTFALDRLSNLEITAKKFVYPADFNVGEYFHYCFGIICPDDDDPQDIILSFKPFQGNYIKTLPLHHTQRVVVDNDEELQVKLKLYITEDLIIELLSFGSSMKVILPLSLAATIKGIHEKAYRKY